MGSLSAASQKSSGARRRRRRGSKGAAVKNKTRKSKKENNKPYVLKGIRFPSFRLVEWIDEAVYATYGDAQGSWGRFISEAAYKLATIILEGKLSPREHFLPQHHVVRATDPDDTFCTNISISKEYIDTIERASCRVNHNISPFLTWAALVEAQNSYKKYPVKRRHRRGGSTFINGGRDVVTAVRFPVDALDRVDAWCDRTEMSRSDFLDEAIQYVLQDRFLEAGVVDLLPETHVLKGDKKTVSFVLSVDRRKDADVGGAVLNHSTTGFLIYASLVYLNHHTK